MTQYYFIKVKKKVLFVINILFPVIFFLIIYQPLLSMILLIFVFMQDRDNYIILHFI